MVSGVNGKITGYSNQIASQAAKRAMPSKPIQKPLQVEGGSLKDVNKAVQQTSKRLYKDWGSLSNSNFQTSRMNVSAAHAAGRYMSIAADVSTKSGTGNITNALAYDPNAMYKPAPKTGGNLLREIAQKQFGNMYYSNDISNLL